MAQDPFVAQNWMHLTPDAQGNYANGIWTKNPIAPMSMPRLYFASNVLSNGKVFVLGGEYSGPGLVRNDSATGEIYDPLSNTWSPITPYPNQSFCTLETAFTGNVTSGSNIITTIPATTGFQTGWTITPITSGSGIPANTTITSVDSSTQIHISQNATASSGPQFNFQVTGNTTAGSTIITGIVPSTAGFKALWTVSGVDVPSFDTVTSVDSSTQIHVQRAATATVTGESLTLGIQAVACVGDDPSMLLPGGKVLAGSIVGTSTYLYDTTSDTWTAAASKVYVDSSVEEGWAKTADGKVVTYDINKSINSNQGYAEIYDPVANSWTGISPGDGSASGTLPLLTSVAIGAEIGPLLRLQDDRIFVIGATGHTALYTPSTNTWAAGPDTIGSLGGSPFLFSADDAPGAIMPDGHVIFAADGGLGLQTTGNTTTGSQIIAGIPSTASLQVDWNVQGTGIPSGAIIQSVDSSTQIHINQNATATGTGVSLKFGGTFSKPTQLFDFDPGTNSISPLSPAPPDSNLDGIPSELTRMLVLPTGQILLSDFSNQLWIFTRTDSPAGSLQPTISQISYSSGTYTLTGTQLSGQSAGSAFGDDAEMDENYPIVRLVSGSGNVYYARTTNWSYVGVGGGTTPQTVNFTLGSSVPPGTYSLIVSGAGISSDPFSVTVPKRVRGQITSQ